MVVSVHALFSTNNLIGSRIIAKGTQHLSDYRTPDCSHVAILINNRWVHEATISSGVRVLSIDTWLKINKEVAKIELTPVEYQVIADKFREIKNKKYDWPGVLFLAACIGVSMFGFNMPITNWFESKHKFFCCEVLGYLTGKNYSMSAPNQILESLLCNKK